MATRDKVIFPLAITRILCHFSIPIHDSPYYTVMGAIRATFVRRSEAQLRPKWPRTDMIDPAVLAIPFTSTPSSLDGGVTLEAIMAQLQCMDARLDTLSDELCQVNTHVGCIARQQACLGGFTASPSHSSEASTNEDGDDGDEDEDEDASSSSDDEMTPSQ